MRTIEVVIPDAASDAIQNATFRPVDGSVCTMELRREDSKPDGRKSPLGKSASEMLIGRPMHLGQAAPSPPLTRVMSWSSGQTTRSTVSGQASRKEPPGLRHLQSDPLCLAP